METSENTEYSEKQSRRQNIKKAIQFLALVAAIYLGAASAIGEIFYQIDKRNTHDDAKDTNKTEQVYTSEENAEEIGNSKGNAPSRIVCYGIGGAIVVFATLIVFSRD